MTQTLAVVLAAVAATAVGTTPALATPSPAEVESQLDAAWEKLEPVIEQYNKVHSELAANQKKADELERQLGPLRAQVDVAMQQVSDLAARQYRDGPAKALNAVLDSDSPQAAAERVALLNYIARRNARQIADVVALRDKYTSEQNQIRSLITEQKQLEADLAARKKNIQAEVDRLEKLRLAAYGAAASPASTASLRIGPCPAVYTGGAGGVAVRTACAQIGKPYVWGTVGPNTFDCSGLTQYAWKAAGVSLTHFTGAQWKEGAPVSRANLQSGDLVFFYSDLHHVGMYVGNGLIVHASRAGVPVRMAHLDDMPYMGARRPS